MKQTAFLPAEWAPQQAVQLTWPHAGTDWAPVLDAILDTYARMAEAIAVRERLIVVAPDSGLARRQMADRCRGMTAESWSRVTFLDCPTDDTWARDHAFLTLSDGCMLDFCFNGWGEKFEAARDNAINRRIFGSLSQLLDQSGAASACYSNQLDFVLEGGAIESDGCGTLFTTTGCLLAPHRNQPLTRDEIDRELRRRLCAERVVWIDHGHLEGDDTDGHIDTLVRVAPGDTLLYVRCDDPADAHYDDLGAMEDQLRQLRTASGQPYRLLPLPLPAPIYDDEGQRLPATYANFLVLNGAVLVPVYAQPERDAVALERVAEAFPGRQVVPLDSRTIILQHGSVHCCTMQYPRW